MNKSSIFLRLGIGQPQLDVDGLAADQVARAGHDVERRQAAGHGPLEARIVHVDRIEDAHAGLDRSAAVGAAQPAAAADVAVRVDQAGHDDACRRRRSCWRSAGIVTSATGPTATILPLSMTSVPFVDLRSGDRNDLGADEGLRPLLGRGGRGQRSHERKDKTNRQTHGELLSGCQSCAITRPVSPRFAVSTANPSRPGVLTSIVSRVGRRPTKRSAVGSFCPDCRLIARHRPNNQTRSRSIHGPAHPESHGHSRPPARPPNRSRSSSAASTAAPRPSASRG